MSLTLMTRRAWSAVPVTPRLVGAFSTTAVVRKEGDTGSVRPGGGSGDAFQARERALEDYAVRQRERERLLLLKKKLQAQQIQLKEISDHIDEITKDQDQAQEDAKSTKTSSE